MGRCKSYDSRRREMESSLNPGFPSWVPWSFASHFQFRVIGVVYQAADD
jgi:hypothetical protein